MGNKCCGSRSIRTSSTGKWTLKKNKVHPLNSSSVNEHHAAPSQDVDIPPTLISEPSNSELSTGDSSLPNTCPDKVPEIPVNADDNKTKDYQQPKDDNTTKDYKQTTDDSTTKDYIQTTDANKTKNYKQTKYDNTTKDYKQTTDDNTTKDYKQTKDDNKTKDNKQTTDDNTTKDYKQTTDDNTTKDYIQTTDANKTKNYKQTKDDNTTKDYKQTTDDSTTKDYIQTTDANKTKNYKQTKYDNTTEGYKQTTDDNTTKDYKQTTDDNTTKDYKQTTDDNKTVPLLESQRSLAATSKIDAVYAGQARIHKVFEELQKSEEKLISKADTKIDTRFSDKNQTNVPSKDQRKHPKSYSELKNEDKDDNSKNKICDKRKSKDIPLANITSLTHFEKRKEHTKQYTNDFEDTRTTKFFKKTTQELRHVPNIDNEITVQDIQFEDEQFESTKSDNTKEKPDTEKYITDKDYLSDDDDTRESESGEESEPEKLSKTDSTSSEDINTETNSETDTNLSICVHEVKSEPKQIQAWKNLAMKPSVQMVWLQNRIKLEQFMKDNIKPQLKIIDRLREEDIDIERKTLSPINKKYKSGTLENLKNKRQISYNKMQLKKHREEGVKKEIEKHKFRMTNEQATKDFPRPASPALKDHSPSPATRANCFPAKSGARGSQESNSGKINYVVFSSTGRRLHKCVDQAQFKKMLDSFKNHHSPRPPTPPPPNMTMFEKIKIKQEAEEIALAIRRDATNEGQRHQPTEERHSPQPIPRQTVADQVIAFDDRKEKCNKKDLETKKDLDTTDGEKRLGLNTEARQCQASQDVSKQKAVTQTWDRCTTEDKEKDYPVREERKCPDKASAGSSTGQTDCDISRYTPRLSTIGAANLRKGQTDETWSDTDSSRDEQQYKRQKNINKTNDGLLPSINDTSTMQDAMTFSRRPARGIDNTTIPGVLTENQPLQLPPTRSVQSRPSYQPLLLHANRTVQSRPSYDTRNSSPRFPYISNQPATRVPCATKDSNGLTNDSMLAKQQPFSFSTESSLANFKQSKPSPSKAMSLPTLERTVNERYCPPKKARSTLLPNIHDSSNMTSDELEEIKDPNLLQRQMTFIDIKDRK
ncbi:uncharacterized protein DDB_G0284459-like isoform X3 [Dreissena polymorpha]|uniref:uncharacterized protein DDB_G0284459-like isoform X3 n=1 Tax=Dreissena polymorpha TaxID=45954 RepID=UPI002264B782|nr:uncharacterized protein DDB_G0284459-like isoform X3 [Dreissena polymorpha]